VRVLQQRPPGPFQALGLIVLPGVAEVVD
jgi:hypothetical protein